jgi:hypothetical protein
MIPSVRIGVVRDGDPSIGSPLDADTQNGLWWPKAAATALFELRSPTFAPMLNWPEGQDITLLVWNVGAQALLAPIFAFCEPVTGLNLAAIAIMVLNGLACAWACETVLERRWAALAGLVLGATSAYSWTESGSGRHDQALWAPMALYLGAYLRIMARPGERRSVLLAAVGLAMAGAVYFFGAIFLLVATACDLAVRGVSGKLKGPVLRDLLQASLLAGLLSIPFIAPVVVALGRSTEALEAIAHSHTDILITQAQASLHPGRYLGLLGGSSPRVAAQAPLLLLPLCLWAGLRAPRGLRAVGWWGLLAASLAAGPLLLGLDQQPLVVVGLALRLPHALLDLLPGFGRFWWPYRWLQLALPAMAICAGAWVAQRRRPALWLGLLVIYAVTECALIIRQPYPRGAVPSSVMACPPVLRALREAEGQSPILYAPLGETPSPLASQACHQQPIDIGLAWHIPGVQPPSYRQRLETTALTRTLAQAARGEAVDAPARWSSTQSGGFRYVLLQPTMDPRGAWRSALERVLGPALHLDAALGLWEVPSTDRAPEATGETRR